MKLTELKVGMWLEHEDSNFLDERKYYKISDIDINYIYLRISDDVKKQCRIKWLNDDYKPWQPKVGDVVNLTVDIDEFDGEDICKICKIVNDGSTRYIIKSKDYTFDVGIDDIEPYIKRSAFDLSVEHGQKTEALLSEEVITPKFKIGDEVWVSARWDIDKEYTDCEKWRGVILSRITEKTKNKTDADFFVNPYRGSYGHSFARVQDMEHVESDCGHAEPIECITNEDYDKKVAIKQTEIDKRQAKAKEHEDSPDGHCEFMERLMEEGRWTGGGRNKILGSQ